jgi:hypothetical protein
MSSSETRPSTSSKIRSVATDAPGTLLDIVDNQGRRRIINPVAVVELTERPDEPAQDESDATYQQAGGPRPFSAGLRDKPL